MFKYVFNVLSKPSGYIRTVLTADDRVEAFNVIQSMHPDQEYFLVEVHEFAPFMFDPYWGAWSRIIAIRGSEIFELDLTPVKNNWAYFHLESFRWHKNSLSDQVFKVPNEIVQVMTVNLGKSATDRLLYFDYLNIISLDELRNSGAYTLKNAQLA